MAVVSFQRSFQTRSLFVHTGAGSRLGTVRSEDLRIMRCCKAVENACSKFTVQFFSPLEAATENRNEYSILFDTFEVTTHIFPVSRRILELSERALEKNIRLAIES